jgi:protein-arginine kinase activator protein McsA
MTKACKLCGEEKPTEDFYAHPDTKDGKFTVCKTCYSARENLKNRLKVGFAALKTDHCECCGRTDVPVHLDHCHQDNLFRGFLCRSCNKTIGMRGDNYTSVMESGSDQMYLDYLRMANYRMGKIV